MNNLERNCPACESEGAEVGNKNGFKLQKCRVCRTLFSRSLPDEFSGENYDEYYDEASFEFPDFVISRITDIIKGFDSFKKTNRFLDIGFGAGVIMKSARALGWNVSGIEVSRPAFENAKREGFDVFNGELREANYPESSFDVVVASEILEHIPDASIVVNEVYRILRPGGLFWATTPSGNGVSYKILGRNWTLVSPPEHLQLFSPKGMRKMLNDAGFSDPIIKTYSVNPSEIVNYVRSGRKRSAEEMSTEFDRNAAGYQLNESLSKSPIKRTFKNVVNETLNLLGIGDSLKISAKK